ncbi:adenosine kinase [Puniceicoccaceae bacterium K14]|nr:adenosine kinase [Puniceicoccaceae bacterium K14]
MAKTYNIYGMGNALVDIVTEVSESFIEQHKIEKGLMTLIDEERQNQLVEAINLEASNLQCGGSAANTVIGAKQFGANCFYSCRVASDEMGQFYMKDLTQNGVSTNLSSDTLPEGATGKCLVMTSSDADRTMNTFLGITADYSSTEIVESAIADSDYLYIEGYLIAAEGARVAMKEALEVAQKNQVKTAITLSDPNMVTFFNNEMKDVIGKGVDLLFCNEEEAKLFTGTGDLESAKEALKKYAKSFAVTEGPSGATVFDGNEFIKIEAYPTNAVDTNGAGDLFAGAYLAAITQGQSPKEAGQLASKAASQVVAQFGPRLSNEQATSIKESSLV